MKKLHAVLAVLALASTAPTAAAGTFNEIKTGPWRPTKPGQATTPAAEVVVMTGSVPPTKAGLRPAGGAPRAALTTGRVAPTKPGVASLADR